MKKLTKGIAASLLALVLVFGMGSTALAQDAGNQVPTAQTESDDGFDWGWLGLLGLIGLAGLAGRNRDKDTVTRTDTTRRDH